MSSGKKRTFCTGGACPGAPPILAPIIVHSTVRRAVVAALVVFACASTGAAQVPPVPAQALPDDLQPRTIGAAGTTTVGLAGYVDRFFSSERQLPTTYTAQLDLARFMTRRVVMHGGVAGTGSVGVDHPDALAAGPGAPALHGFGGILFYFTPQSMVSLYSGAEYWAQLTRRSSEDAGSIVGELGLQGAFSSATSVFVEGGYGLGLARDDEGHRLHRFVGQIGVRLKL